MEFNIGDKVWIRDEGEESEIVGKAFDDVRRTSLCY